MHNLVHVADVTQDEPLPFSHFGKASSCVIYTYLCALYKRFMFEMHSKHNGIDSHSITVRFKSGIKRLDDFSLNVGENCKVA